jgi:hypothetical protein
VLLKTLCDQAIFAPAATAMFLGAIRCMEGRSNEAVSTVQTQLRPCLKANYMLWPAAHVINFAFVPASQRILYVNVIAVRTQARFLSCGQCRPHVSTDTSTPALCLPIPAMEIECEAHVCRCFGAPSCLRW